jgi:hypothetical protein
MVYWNNAKKNLSDTAYKKYLNKVRKGGAVSKAYNNKILQYLKAAHQTTSTNGRQSHSK